MIWHRWLGDRNGIQPVHNLASAIFKGSSLEHLLETHLIWSNLWKNTPTLSLGFNGHFPGEPELAGSYWSKGWWRWWWQLDYWSCKSCKAPVKSSPPTNQHPVFYMPDALPVAQPTVSKHWGEYHYSMALLTPSSPGGLPTLSLNKNWN